MKVKKGLYMNKGISLNLYRFLDIAIFSFIGLLFEYISFKILNIYDYPYYSISVSLLINLLIMKRWGKYSLFYSIISGLFYVYLNNGNLINYFIYGIGNIFILFDLFLLYKKKDSIKSNIFINSLFIINGFILSCLGRSVVALIFKKNIIETFISFVGTESLNLIFSLIILNIIRNIDGLYEDQVEYIKRIKLEVSYGRY